MPVADERLQATGVRRLTPEIARIFEGAFSLLHCAVKDDRVYRGVFAVLMFPIQFPSQYISLRYTDEKDKIREIGIIEDLNQFPEETRQQVQATLKKQYHEQVITRIHEVKLQYGLLFFDVETTHGRREFLMPWRYDRAEDFGANGKVLLDVSDNRFILPDVEALSAHEQRRFTSYIYW